MAPEIDLDDVVKVMYGTGDVNRVARVRGRCDAPQFLLEDGDRDLFWWRIDLCKEATEEEKSTFVLKERLHSKNYKQKGVNEMADTKLRELLAEAEAELEQDLKVKSKTLIKERLKEIRSMQKTLKTMEEQFEKLLECDISDIEDLE